MLQSNYQSVQSYQSNSESLHGRKIKPRTQFDENAQVKKIKKSQLKRSFEDNNQSPSQQQVQGRIFKKKKSENVIAINSIALSNNQVIYKNSINNDKTFKITKPSIKQGQSPQASSTSSKYCFSNRSSNLSQNMQNIPIETINQANQLYFHIQNQQITSGQKDLKVNKDHKSNQAAKQQFNFNKNLSHISPSQKFQRKLQQQSPQSQTILGIPQVSFTIAEERISIKNQVPAETPKFNQYYTLLGRQNIVRIAKNVNNNLQKIDIQQNRTSNQYARSKSLQRDSILTSSLIGNQILNTYCNNDIPSVKNSFQENELNEFNDIQVEMVNQEKRLSDLSNVNILNKCRIFVQSHSSLSQQNEKIQQQDKSVSILQRIASKKGTIEENPSSVLKQSFKKGKKVIKLKKSDIKFQQQIDRTDQVQGTDLTKNFNNYQSSCNIQDPLLNKGQFKQINEEYINQKQQNMNNKRYLTLNTHVLTQGGIMIGSPKMQQIPQEAKLYNDSCVISSHSSLSGHSSIYEQELEIEDDDEIKISYIKAEKHFNQVKFSKEAINNDHHFKEEQNQDESFEIKYNRIRSIQQVRKSSDTFSADQLKSIQQLYKNNLQIKQQQFKHISDDNLNKVLSIDYDQLNTLEQIQLKRERELQLAIQSQHYNPHSAATTYRDNPQNYINSNFQNDNNKSKVHFSNAKQEFLQISEAKVKKDIMSQMLQDYQQDQFLKQNVMLQQHKIIDIKNDVIQSNPQTTRISSAYQDNYYEDIQVNGKQFYFQLPEDSIISIQSNIATEGYPGQINNKSISQIYGLTCLLKTQSYLILQDEKIMFEIISLLKHEEMCRFSICLLNKKLGQIRHIFQKQQSVLTLSLSQEQMMKNWKYQFLPKSISNDLTQYYFQISSFTSQYDFEIEKDIERTYPNDYFFSKNQLNYKKMKRILKATAYHLPQVGYVQGFNFIVGALMKILKNEEEIFWMFVNILQFKDIYRLYIEGMPLLKQMQFNLNCFVQNLLPEIELYLSKKNIILECFTSQWILTLFSFEFELDFFRCFLNNLLLIGPQFILQLSLALIDYASIDLLSISTMEEAMDFLKDFTSIKKLPILEIFSNALKFTQVTPGRLAELNHIYKTNKSKKRVLFVKDQDQNVTYLKTLPNLPDEQMTECNVDEESQDSFSSEEDASFIGRQGLEFKKASKIKKQINSSFYLNNVSQPMDVRPASSLESDINANNKVSIDDDCQDEIFQENKHEKQKFYLYSNNGDSKLNLKVDDYISHYFTNESDEQTKEAKVCTNITSAKNIFENINQNISLEEQSDPTPLLDIEKSKLPKNFINSKKTIKKADLILIQKSEKQITSNFEYGNKQRQQELESLNYNTKMLHPQELLEQMQKRRFLHSPSVDNLRSSFKINQKSQSQMSILMSPNSENLLESGCKINQDYIYDRYDHQLRKLTGIDSRINLQQQQKQEEEMTKIIDESHNISNIEEFYDNFAYDSVHDKYQYTQRYTSRRDLRDDLSERESLKLSWTKTKPLHQQLQLHLDIDKQGSHLNTPHFQQTNRSNILCEKKLTNPVNSLILKQNALITKNIKISENQNPNTDHLRISNQQQGLKVNQSLKKQPSIQRLHQNAQQNEEQRIVFEKHEQVKCINNYQRFSATSKFQSKQQKKNVEKQKNRILHNWSANHPNMRDSNELGTMSSRNSNQNIEEVIKSVKQTQNANKFHTSLQKQQLVIRSNRTINKQSLMNGNQGQQQQSCLGPLSSRDDYKGQLNSHRSMFAQTIQLGQLSVATSNDFDQYIQNQGNTNAINGNSKAKQVPLNSQNGIQSHHQPSNSLGGISDKSQISKPMFKQTQKQRRGTQQYNIKENKQQAAQKSDLQNYQTCDKNIGILSPRTIANNKQSHQILVHKGDNYFDEGEMNTTLLTPKEGQQFQ